MTRSRAPQCTYFLFFFFPFLRITDSQRQRQFDNPDVAPDQSVPCQPRQHIPFYLFIYLFRHFKYQDRLSQKLPSTQVASSGPWLSDCILFWSDWLHWAGWVWASMFYWTHWVLGLRSYVIRHRPIMVPSYCWLTVVSPVVLGGVWPDVHIMHVPYTSCNYSGAGPGVCWL